MLFPVPKILHPKFLLASPAPQSQLELRVKSWENRGKKFWKGDFGSGNAWEGGAAFPSVWDLFIFFPLLLKPLYPSWIPQIPAEQGQQPWEQGKLQENQPGVTLRDPQKPSGS